MESITKTPTYRAAGNVQLILNNETVLIPTPSPDPKDPLNLPPWRKWAILIIQGLFGSTSVILASGMGAIITDVQRSYPGEEARTNDLLTYPTLFMGIANLFAIPLSMAVGRRPVFLITMVALVASGIGCALAPNLSAHIAFRDIMSFAAGQSEALCPLAVQEVHFLHERGRKIAWFVFIENVICGIFFITSTYIVEAGGWRWWYGTFTIINFVVLILSYFLATETWYERPEDASQGAVHLNFNDKGEVDKAGDMHRVIRVTTAQGNVLEPERYGVRTWKQDLKVFPRKPNWSAMGRFYKSLAQGLLIPTMFWLLLLNGAFLSLYIITSATFAGILIPPPYSWSFSSLGYIFIGQIASCLIFLPLLGYGNDLMIKGVSKLRGGIYQPEYRFFNLAIPTIVTVVCGVMYGQAAAHPYQYSWGTIAVTFGGVFFGFLGANVVGVTYAVEAFPLRAEPFLVMICAGRGLISFGLSYSVLPAVAALGYDGTMNVESIIAGVLGLIAIPMYLAGPKIRLLANRYLKTGQGHE
ncbi:MFS general substrate transporter [Periconia macrospinosa]|uniref:MFS general substrate transporter n=1 Tax=Periconia macrospinosa TaxID=97972 RepID=A0A2V1E5G6_9PLEO|nr:MFS general substrate transporter [Periconia macrospinosa]